MKIGLCLSGGGIRCAAQIGVIRALEEQHIPIHAVAGTSGGSIVAALHAVGFSPQEMQRIFTQCGAYLISPTKKLGYLWQGASCLWRKPFGIIEFRAFEKMLTDVFERVGVSGMPTVKKPLAIPAVDIKSQQLVMFVSDRTGFDNCPVADCVYYSDTMLATAVRASCSLPVVFTPREVNDHTLVDGGLRLNVPVYPLRVFGCDKVLAVDMSCIEREEDAADNAYKLISRTIDIMSHNLSERQTAAADVRLDIDLCDIGLLSLDKIEHCVQAGYDATIRQMDQIMTKLYLEEDV